MSPYDEFAVEEAIRLKEKNADSTVKVLSAGPDRISSAIRSALAMGADSGIQIDLPETADNHLTAKALAEALKKEAKVDIVFTGKEAIDDGSAQVSQLLAEFLEIPCLTVLTSIEYTAGTSVVGKREIEGGAFEVIESPLPAVLAAQKGLNEPRYASLPNIMKAKKKPIDKISFTDLGLSAADQKIKFKNYKLPPPRQAGKKINGEPDAQTKELVRLLNEEAKVL